MDQRLPAAGAVELEQIEEVVVGAPEPLRGVRQDREERDDPGADEQRRLRRRRVDEDQRRDGDDRRHLQDHRIGIERQLDPARLRHQHGERDAADQRDAERDEGDLHRDVEARQEHRPVGVERLGDPPRARQDVMRHIGEDDVDLPGADQREQHDDRQRYAKGPLGGAGLRRAGQAIVLGSGAACQGSALDRAHRRPSIASCRAAEARRQFSL